MQTWAKEVILNQNQNIRSISCLVKAKLTLQHLQQRLVTVLRPYKKIAQMVNGAKCSAERVEEISTIRNT